MHINDTAISIDNITLKLSGREILKQVSFDIRANEHWAVIGPNGAGKSSLIKIIAGMIPQTDGVVRVNNKPVKHYSSRNRASLIAYVPQKPENAIPYTVNDYVMLGRFCRMSVLGIPDKHDQSVVDDALDICDVYSMKERYVYSLSGGELQRVLLAGAVAQESPILLLDEPTTYLDPAHDKLFFNALDRLNARAALTVVMVTHDINSAIYRCSYIAVIRDGALYYTGKSSEFRTQCPEMLTEIFSIQFRRYRCVNDGFDVFGSWEE